MARRGPTADDQGVEWLYFGPFRWDGRSGRLYRGEDLVALRPKSSEVLRILIEHRGTVLSRHQLLQMVWREVTVGQEVLGPSIVEIRRALGDSAKAPTYIETLHGRGVRFTANVAASSTPMPEPAPTADNATSLGPFVGRNEILHDLEEALQCARRGEPRVFAIDGPAGIGKTRLLREVAAIAARLGVEALYGRAEEVSQHSIFWIWSQILSSFAESHSPAELRDVLGDAGGEIARVVPSVQEALRLKPVSESRDPRAARTAFFEAVAAFIRNLAARRPLLLLFDDLHRGGEGSLALLEWLGDVLEHDRVLTVLAFRHQGEPSNPALTSLLARRVDAANRRSLAGLEAEEARQLILTASSAQLAHGLVDRIARETAGNPYFMLEIVRSLEGAAAPDTAGAESYSLPTSVRRVLERRFSHLGSATLLFLRAAAVLGSSCERELARQVAGIGEEDCREAIAESVAAGLIAVGPQGMLCFNHDLLAEALREGMPANQRAEHSRRAAQTIEATHHSRRATPASRATPAIPAAPAAPATTAVLAHHFAEAADLVGALPAVEYAVRAAQSSLSVYANQEAYASLVRALAVAEKDPTLQERQIVPLLDHLTETYARLGRFAESEATAERLSRIAHRYGDADELARSAMALARSYFPYRPLVAEKPLQALEQAMAARQLGATLLDGMLCARLAAALLVRSDGNQRRIRFGWRAVEICRQLPDPSDRLRLWFETLPAFWDADHLAERAELGCEFLAAARAHGDRYMVFAAASWLCLTLLAQGRLPETHALIAEASMAAVGDRHWDPARRYLLRLRIVDAVASGKLAQADQWLARFADFQPHADGVSSQFETALAQAVIQRERGTLKHIAPMLSIFAESFPLRPLRAMVILVYAESGMLDEAESELRRLPVNFFESLPRNEALGWLASAAALADAAAALGDREWSARQYGYLLPYEGQWPVVHLGVAWLGSVSRCLGRLAAVLGDSEAALQHFARAQHESEAQNALPELARTKLHQGLALRRLAAAPDTVSLALHEALAIATEHDLPALRAEAEAALAPQSTLRSA